MQPYNSFYIYSCIKIIEDFIDCIRKAEKALQSKSKKVDELISECVKCEVVNPVIVIQELLIEPRWHICDELKKYDDDFATILMGTFDSKVKNANEVIKRTILAVVQKRKIIVLERICKEEIEKLQKRLVTSNE